MKIVVAIASHDREKPLSLVLRCMPAAWHAVLVLTTGEDPAPYLKRPNTHVYHHANSPLGAKWQHAVNMARTHAPDLLIIDGSDDVLLGNTAKLVATMEDTDMLGFMGFEAFDGANHYWLRYKPHVKMPIGGGRVYTRALLDRMRWRLFDVHREKWLDEYGYANARRVGDGKGGPARIKLVDRAPGLQVVALKGDWPQKNSMAKYLRGKNIDVTPLDGVKHSVYYNWL